LRSTLANVPALIASRTSFAQPSGSRARAQKIAQDSGGNDMDDYFLRRK
jgi:hypothetical protein